MKPFPKSPIAYLWLYAMRNKKIFLPLAICGILSVVLEKMSPYLFSKMVALFGEGSKFANIENKLWLLLTGMVLATVFAKVLSNIFHYLSTVRFRAIVYKQMSLDCFRYINGHSVSYFADNMAGSLAQKSEQLAGNASFYTALFYYLSDIVQLIVIFVMLMSVNTMFACAFMGFLLLSILVLFRIGKLSINLRSAMVEAKNKVSGQMIDTLQNNFFVRVFNGFDYEKKRLHKELLSESQITNKSVNVEALQSQGEKLYFQIIYILFLFYGFYLWKIGQIKAADMVLIFLLLQNVSDTVSYLIHRGIIYSGVFAEMRTNLIPFSQPHEIEDAVNAFPLQVKQGNIEFRHVNFGYHKDRLLFKNFNLTIPAGQKVGIVGASGGGKSSLINLLQRFFDVSSGEILIDGQNIKAVTQDSLHQAISYVPQTSSLLERSIAENIAYGRVGATQSEIEKAAQDAYAAEFIEALPNGYKTLLNAQNQLSGGQMQRLSIARALLKDAPILVLDEATSALDSESEFYIQKAIEKMLQGKTVIAVAHRLSTLKNMDRIIVLEKGKIVEDGTLEELLSRKGKFYQYWTLQKLEGAKHE